MIILLSLFFARSRTLHPFPLPLSWQPHPPSHQHPPNHHPQPLQETATKPTAAPLDNDNNNNNDGQRGGQGQGRRTSTTTDNEGG